MDLLAWAVIFFCARRWEGPIWREQLNFAVTPAVALLNLERMYHLRGFVFLNCDFSYIYLHTSLREVHRSLYARRGAQRPFLHVHELKKTGAHTGVYRIRNTRKRKHFSYSCFSLSLTCLLGLIRSWRKELKKGQYSFRFIDISIAWGPRQPWTPPPPTIKKEES